MGTTTNLAAFARSKGIRLLNDNSVEAQALPVNGEMPIEFLLERINDPDQNLSPNHTAKEFYDSTGGRNKDVKTSLAYLNSRFKSRREYFWWASQQYDIHVDRIQSHAEKLGIEEDFGKLVDWMNASSPLRNK